MEKQNPDFRLSTKCGQLLWIRERGFGTVQVNIRIEKDTHISVELN